MLDKIDINDITLQVESSKSDREVPDGIAISKGTFDLGLYEGSSSTFTEMGMIKNGNQAMTTSFANVTGWTANAAFPSTVITSNALVLANAAQVAITLRAQFGNGWQNQNAKSYVRILVNGVVVREASGGYQNSITAVINANTGDSISIQAKMTSWTTLFSGGNNLQGSNTWVKVKLNRIGAFDFETDLVWPDKTEFISTGDIRYAVPPGKAKGRKPSWRNLINFTQFGVEPDQSYSLEHKEYSGFTVGPVLTQTRVPIPCEGGMTVDMYGKFSMRGISNSGDGALKNDLDQSTKGIIRFSVWGRGVVKDEYGVDVYTIIELMYYEALLSTSNTAFTVVDISGVPAATVPAGITELMFTASTLHETGGLYGTMDWEFEGTNKAYKAQYLGNYTDGFPLRIVPSLPSGVNRTYTHSLSKTGVAFKNRARFDNIQPSCDVTFFGYPGSTTGINIYNWVSGARGSLIGTYTTTTNERKTVSITPTGTDQIEIVKSGSNDFFIESVKNNSGSNLTTLWNGIEYTTFVNINDDISKVSISREEGDKGTLTVDFSTTSLDPAISAMLKPGKTVRFLGRHYDAGDLRRPSDWVGEANNTVIYQGIIKRITSKYSYDDEPIVQLTAYNAQDAMDRLTTGIMCDSYMEYGAYYNRLGVPVLYNTIDWGGWNKLLPNRFTFRPSSYGEFSFTDSLSATRNTGKTYYIVDRFNRLQILTSLSSSTVITLTDGTLTGDISYGDLNMGSDTDTVINKVTVSENSLDRKDLVDKTLSGGDEPPLDINYVATKNQSAVFRNLESINDYGEFEKTFQVVRGNGDLLDLRAGKLGGSFEDWADAILDAKSEPTLNVSDLIIPIKSSDDIRLISQLEILDKIAIVYKGETYTIRIRDIDHTITPGKWTVKLSFVSKADMTYWG